MNVEGPEDTDTIIQRMGWNDDTMLQFYRVFVAERGLETEFDDYLREKATYEEKETRA